MVEEGSDSKILDEAKLKSLVVDAAFVAALVVDPGKSCVHKKALALVGQLKNVGVVYLSVLLFGSTVTSTQSLGYVIAIGGFLCYSHVKAEASKAAAARKERSALDGGRGEEGKPAGPKGGLKGAQP